MSIFGSYTNPAFSLPLQYNPNARKLRKESYVFWSPLFSSLNVYLYILSTSVYREDWMTDQDQGLCWVGRIKVPPTASSEKNPVEDSRTVLAAPRGLGSIFSPSSSSSLCRTHQGWVLTLCMELTLDEGEPSFRKSLRQLSILFLEMKLYFLSLCDNFSQPKNPQRAITCSCCVFSLILPLLPLSATTAPQSSQWDKHSENVLSQLLIVLLVSRLISSSLTFFLGLSLVFKAMTLLRTFGRRLFPPLGGKGLKLTGKK